MTAPVDISRAECERLATALQGATLFQSYDDALAENNEAAALILALRAELDAAEAARQSDADFWQQEIARMADPVGYARGVRDAAREAHRLADFYVTQEAASKIAAAMRVHDAILALLPATKKETNDA